MYWIFVGKENLTAGEQLIELPAHIQQEEALAVLDRYPPEARAKLLTEVTRVTTARRVDRISDK